MINRFYQTINKGKKNERKVLDFHKIAQDKKDIFIILSEREQQGKTMNAFEYIKDRWDTHKEKAVFILNTTELFDINLHKLIRGNKTLYSEKWENVTIDKYGLYENKRHFVYFVSVSGYYKFKIGTRDPNIRTIIYDEFNEGLRNIGHNQAVFFENILMSASSDGLPIKCFIFGNQRTLDVPLLTELDITEIKTEYEEIEPKDKKGKPLGFKVGFFCPVKTKAEIKKLETSGNWTYGLSKQLRLYSMSVLNIGNLDNNSGVVPKDNHFHFKKKTLGDFLFFARGCYAKIWKDEKRNWFLEWKREVPANVRPITLKLRNVDFDLEYNFNITYDLKNALLDEKIYFSNYIVKQLFLKDISGR